MLIKLFIAFGFVFVALSTTSFFLERQDPRQLVADGRATDSSQDAAVAVNWDDVNLGTGLPTSPEEDVKTARSNVLRDFEAR